MNKEVDKYLSGLKNWKEELTLLREIIVACGSQEEVKWMHLNLKQPFSNTLKKPLK